MTTVRLMRGDTLYATTNLNNYQDVASTAFDIEETVVDGEVVMDEVKIEDLSIHPDDMEAVMSSLVSRNTDRNLQQAGADEREVRVWTSTVAILNLKLMAALIESSKETWGENIPAPIAEFATLSEQLLIDLEANDQITSALGLTKVTTKAVSMGKVAHTAYVDALTNTAPPIL